MQYLGKCPELTKCFDIDAPCCEICEHQFSNKNMVYSSIVFTEGGYYKDICCWHAKRCRELIGIGRKIKVI